MLIKIIAQNPWIMIIIVLLYVGLFEQHHHYPADYYEQTTISTGNLRL